MQFDPAHFEAGLVEVSAPAVYAALRLADVELSVLQQLHAALKNAAHRRCQSDFLSLAESGMPDAILPFHRPHEDVLYAAACYSRGQRLRLSGMGNVVEAGFFELDEPKCRYVDQVDRTAWPAREILPVGTTWALCRQLKEWTQRPQVEVGDLMAGEFLKLQSNVSGLRSLPSDPPVNPRLQHLGVKSVISILRVHEGEPDPRLAHPIRAETLSEGEGTLEREAGTWVLRNPRPELVMEMHAAWLNEPDPTSLWLLIRRHGEQFLAPLPDLMQTGARSGGWWVPTRDLFEAMGTPGDGTELKIPRRAAMLLMERYPWFAPMNPKESAVLAWWMRERATSSAAHSQSNTAHS